MRLRDVVRDVPKPMAPVGGRPFLEYLVAQLLCWNVSDIVLATGYMGEAIESYFGDGEKQGVAIRYSREEEPLGTGGGLRKAIGLIGDADFIAMNGDSFVNLDFGRLLAFHASHGGIATICLVPVKDASRYGRVETGEDNRVVAFSEKGGAGEGWINAGVYVFGRRIAGHIPPGRVSLEQEVLPGLIPLGIYGFPSEEFFIDIGIPEDYSAACGNPERLRAARIPR